MVLPAIILVDVLKLEIPAPLTSRSEKLNKRFRYTLTTLSSYVLNEIIVAPENKVQVFDVEAGFGQTDTLNVGAL